eukprot:852481-Pyramimonas_sp.AAC.1
MSGPAVVGIPDGLGNSTRFTRRQPTRRSRCCLGMSASEVICYVILVGIVLVVSLLSTELKREATLIATTSPNPPPPPNPPLPFTELPLQFQRQLHDGNPAYDPPTHAPTTAFNKLIKHELYDFSPPPAPPPAPQTPYY